MTCRVEAWVAGQWITIGFINDPTLGQLSHVDVDRVTTCALRLTFQDCDPCSLYVCQLAVCQAPEAPDAGPR